MSSAPLVVLVEDEEPLRRFLRAALSGGDYRLVEAATAREGLRQVANQHPDLILLDLGLPDRDGLDLLAEIRSWSTVPVIVISARGQERDKVHALDQGADDYLTKPFGIAELMARIRVALRHAVHHDTPAPVVRGGNVRIDLDRRRVTLDGREVRLTATEYRLLSELARHAGKVLTHAHLLKAVWGLHTRDQIHLLRVYAAQVRAKLEVDPSQPRLLRTESGVGYRLEAEPEEVGTPEQH